MTESWLRALALLLAAAIGPGPAAAPAIGAGVGTTSPQSRLVIVGGGERPSEALKRFVTWAGGAQSRLLVVAWASDEPKQGCDAILGELRPHAPGEAACAPFAPLDAQGKAGRLDAESRARFLVDARRLRARASAYRPVFFRRMSM